MVLGRRLERFWLVILPRFHLGRFRDLQRLRCMFVFERLIESESPDVVYFLFFAHF
jgi:hypothetical protein